MAGKMFYIKPPLQLCRVLYPHPTACKGDSQGTGTSSTPGLLKVEQGNSELGW